MIGSLNTWLRMPFLHGQQNTAAGNTVSGNSSANMGGSPTGIYPGSQSQAIQGNESRGAGVSGPKRDKRNFDTYECQTCKNRKYQDGSDDPGVSYKTPTNISPEKSAASVRAHEKEHVVREQAKAQREGRRVVSQDVTYQTGICPECGKVYIAGGTTRTVTKAQAKNLFSPDTGPTLGQYLDLTA